MYLIYLPGKIYENRTFWYQDKWGMWEGRESERLGKKGKQVAQGQDSVFLPTGQQLSRERKKKHKKKALNSYLPTLKEFKRYADVRDPVDPL